MKIVTIVGARPQFIKAAPVSKALRIAGHREFLLHTGQHYDYGMSQVFFDELELPEPDANLGVGSGSHGWQTGQMLVRIEEVLLAEAPDGVLVYGDTNSTLAGALAAVKMHLPLAHVEAGLRSHNREMPEEINRLLTDRCANLLFCPTQTALHNLEQEGLTQGVNWVGDTMYDAVIQAARTGRLSSAILNSLQLSPKGYLLATLHRAGNTDDPARLRAILEALARIDEPVVFPVHPRTRQKMVEFGLSDLVSAPSARNLRCIEPVGYLDMLGLERNARLILTDSGGMQKEACFLKVPCITLRPETEWVETVQAGWNILVGDDFARLPALVRTQAWPTEPATHIYGDGRAANKIVKILDREWGL